MRSLKGDAASKRRLRVALSEMVDKSEPLTVSALCINAGVSRTTAYKHHSDVIKELRRARGVHRDCLQHDAPQSRSGVLREERLNEENARLRQQFDAAVALLDHYYCAWREVSELLRRREGELAQLRRAVGRAPTLLRR